MCTKIILDEGSVKWLLGTKKKTRIREVVTKDKMYKRLKYRLA